MRSAKQKVNKLQVLKEIAKGKRSVSSLLPPRSYIVTCKDGFYDVNAPDGANIFVGVEQTEKGHVRLNEEQYKAFKETLREIDIVFELSFCNFGEPKEQEQQRLAAPQKQLPAPQKLLPYTESDKEDNYSPANTPGKQTPAKGAKAKKKPVMMIEQPVIQMKQSGLLSEYGTTWKASFIR